MAANLAGVADSWIGMYSGVRGADMERRKMRENGNDSGNEEDLLNDAKERLLAQAREYDFWKPVRDNPLTSVGIAFLAGVGASFLSRDSKIVPLVTPLAEIGALTAKYFLTKTRP